ncbi:hypothetical protein ACFSUS_14250 [Spirosoma soli]|uniref:Family 43 glycosylhydrolase n=1 Tax=Spirosoma soli TaxID=1770529 RepID=A0ABW5M581_9BACT
MKQPARWSLALLLLLFHRSNAQNISLERFASNPIISASSLPGQDGDDINGPSLIKVPDWLPNKLGKYYLYFAHHKGKYIRLAYADDLHGPWKIYQPGTLQITDCRCNDAPFPATESVRHEGAENAGDGVTHVASPDVHIDDRQKQLILYFHCPLEHKGQKGQYTLRATTRDGIHFKADTAVLGESYFRVFQWNDKYYAIGRSSAIYRSNDGKTEFEKGPNPFAKIQKPNALRHSAVKLVGDTLWVFYSRVGDTPERILLTKIKLTDNWTAWTATPPQEVAAPQTDYEGANLPLTTSKIGLYYGKVRELRDPYVFEENKNWYLLYSAAGENAIAIGRLIFDKQPVANRASPNK